tara:strand:- start:558 stop:884 length:327 start_codon:yes stop_codon:yes gene_type:complete
MTMQLGIIINTNDLETAWNGLRLGIETLARGNEVNMFLLGSGVEIENIKNKTFDINGALKKFLGSGGNILACGTCLKLRHQEAGICSVSTMVELAEMISDSDKVVTFG